MSSKISLTTDLASQMDYATKHRLSMEDLQTRVEIYVDEGRKDPKKRDAIIVGALWISLTELLAYNKRSADPYNGLWETTLEQHQVATDALFSALGAYKTGLGASFYTHASSWIRFALKKHHRDLLVNLARAFNGDFEPLTTPVPSVMQMLIAEEERKERVRLEAKIVPVALHTLGSMPATERLEWAKAAGLTPKKFRQAFQALCEEFGATGPRQLPKKIQNVAPRPPRAITRKVTEQKEGRTPLTSILCQKFVILKQRKGLSIAEVKSALSAEFNAAGINASAASAYTLLHAVSPSKNQTTIGQPIVDALQRVYAARPDTHYLASDEPFQALCDNLHTRHLTCSDFLGLLRSEKLVPKTYTPDSATGMYLFLSERRGAVPILAVQTALAKLSVANQANKCV
jgi:hypothetical protein